MVRQIVAAAALVALLVAGCSDDGSDGEEGASASTVDPSILEAIPRLSLDLDALVADLEDGEVELPAGFRPPTSLDEIDQECLGNVLTYLAAVDALEEGDLMLWYTGVDDDEEGPVSQAVLAVLAAGDCLTS